VAITSCGPTGRDFGASARADDSPTTWPIFNPPPAKAAAIKAYVKYWALAQRWIKDHPDEWLKAYYEDDQGLDAADGKWLIRNAGTPVIPTSWTKPIAEHQETIDLLSQEEGQPDTKAQDLWDMRFEHVAGQSFASGGSR